MKVLIKIVCALALFVGLQQLIELKTRGFCLQKILASDLTFNPRWEIPPLNSQEQENISRVLDQPYTFLGAGSECFAFLSKDGKTVLKFLKLDVARPVYIHRGLLSEDHSAHAGTLSTLQTSHPLLKRIFGMREYRIGRTFNSLKLAYDHLKEETGLFYLHLNPTACFHKTLTLFDPNGIAHEIDLDTTRFYLQERAIPLEKYLLTLKKQGKHEKAQECILSLCDMILSRCRKGFADRDVLNRNFGVIDNRAVEIDSGSFIPHSPMKEPHLYKQELFFSTLELKEWAKENYPELLRFLEANLAEKLQHKNL